MGAVKLIQAIGKHDETLNMCVNWENTKNIPDSRYLDPSPHLVYGGYGGDDSDGWEIVRSQRRRRLGQLSAPPQGRGWPRPQHFPTAEWGRHYHAPIVPQGWEPRHALPPQSYQGGPPHPPLYHHGPPRHLPYHAEGVTPRGQTHIRRGCYNCGEFNHRQSMCRFDHRVKCSVCHAFGHKSRLCNQYSE